MACSAVSNNENQRVHTVKVGNYNIGSVNRRPLEKQLLITSQSGL